jgi:ABC-type glycerol-3-phosphate transport system substrate-binding protein
MRRPLIVLALIAIALAVAACGGSKPVTGESEVREGSPIVTSYVGKPLAIFFFHPF